MSKLLLLCCLLLPVVANSEQRFLYGAIRNYGYGWKLISDANHAPQNISGVVTNSSGIRINYGFTAKSVGTFIVTPDETYARHGVVCGASVGLSYSLIQCSDHDGVIDPMSLVNAGGNLWIYGVMNQ